jgi:hypothetical protein
MDILLGITNGMIRMIYAGAIAYDYFSIKLTLYMSCCHISSPEGTAQYQVLNIFNRE